MNDDRGETQLRGSLYAKTAQDLRATAELGVVVPNTLGLPIVEISLVSAADIDAVGHYLYEAGSM